MQEQPQDQVDTSEDEKLTEREALDRAKAEGIYFVDDFLLAPADNSMQTLPKSYATREEAQTAAAALEGEYVIVQRRQQKQPVEQ